MKQILQNLKDGSTELVEVPCPRVGRGALLIRTTRSLVSVGTERMLVDFGKANPIEKARQQPDKVKQVLEKVKTDGLVPTVEAVRSKLEQPLALGYCNVGVVEQVGTEGRAFAVGDRVVSNGKHAEVVSVPVNLCARIPDAVSDEAAAFTVIGAIGLQGIRLVAPSLGEAVVVTGLGLIGLMTVQLLRAHGCRVLGIDMDPVKLALARRFGAETVDLSAGQDPMAVAEAFSRGRGVDAVIITAATRSNEPVHQAALMCRKRGRIVLVGVVGLALSRADFYEKELSFQVSCSYGPGRYDPLYEEQGQDYPVGFVRWTEQRNFEAVLDMLADERLDVAPLVSHRFALEQAERAYEVVGGAAASLGIILEYPGGDADRLLDRTVRFGVGRGQGAGVSASAGLGAGGELPSVALGLGLPVGTTASDQSGLSPRHSGREAEIRARNGAAQATQTPTVSFVGSGNYATGVLIPAFKAAGATLRTVASSGGVSGVHAGRKFGFAQTTTDTEALFADVGTDALVITTRHDSHARFVLQALRAGKAVFVEKPLCLTLEELEELAEISSVVPAGKPEHSATDSGHTDQPLLMVGFNRRFAPHVRQMKQLLAGVTAPKAFVMTVNAGAIPAAHWTQDPAVGGGRLIGEACHFIDLLRFLSGAPIVSHERLTMDSATGDTLSLQLGFADGSIGTVHYFANGSKAFPKERLEIFAGGRVLQLDNFRRLTGYGWPKFKPLKLWRQDKGQKACAAAFVQRLREGGPAPIPLDEILEVSRVTIELAEGATRRSGNTTKS